MASAIIRCLSVRLLHKFRFVRAQPLQKAACNYMLHLNKEILKRKIHGQNAQDHSVFFDMQHSYIENVNL